VWQSDIRAVSTIGTLP
jgi:hypothetical protein